MSKGMKKQIKITRWFKKYQFEIVDCAELFGFHLARINGSHHIYPDIPKLINLQDVDGKAKPYQVKQLLQLIERYNLQIEDKK